MTAIVYFSEMLVASLLAIGLLAISQLRISSDAVLFASGVVALTLAEYVVHRFVLHGFAPIEHRLHHANPDDAVLTIFWQIWICFGLVYLIAGGAFVAGALIAYAWYLFAHHCAHHDPNKLPLPLLKHHKIHHRFASRNYGVSTTLWDHVFGRCCADKGSASIGAFGRNKRSVYSKNEVQPGEYFTGLGSAVSRSSRSTIRSRKSRSANGSFVSVARNRS